MIYYLQCGVCHWIVTVHTVVVILVLVTVTLLLLLPYEDHLFVMVLFRHWSIF